MNKAMGLRRVFHSTYMLLATPVTIIVICLSLPCRCPRAEPKPVYSLHIWPMNERRRTSEKETTGHASHTTCMLDGRIGAVGASFQIASLGEAQG
jgi:hypothetical protein